jgi:hypothetical protein
MEIQCYRINEEFQIRHSVPLLLQRATVLPMQGYPVAVLGVHLSQLTDITFKWNLKDIISFILW